MMIIEVLAIICFFISSKASATCANGSVRLVGGCDSFEGRVELCVNDEWGTVCDDQWDEHDAEVVCRQVKMNGAGAMAIHEAHFGEGSGNIWIDSAECLGDEQTLFDCNTDPIGVHNCDHSEDSGVKCPTACTCGDVRVIGGEFYYEGHVEICMEGEWKTVTLCDQSWDDIDAEVTCSQLGYISPGSVALQFNSYFTVSQNTFMEELACSGNEGRLLDCSFNHTDVQDCDSFEVAGIKCAVSNVTFIPFGSEASDHETLSNDGQFHLEGPLILENPLVFHLQEHYQLYISNNGIVSFEELNNAKYLKGGSSVPLISTLWSTLDPNSTVYSRVTKNSSTLELIREYLMKDNKNNFVESFQPCLAVVVTWISHLSETLQIVLSTDGRISYATFILNDGEGLRALSIENLLSFNAGDQRRTYTFNRTTSSSLSTINGELGSFRIDGNCVNGEVRCSLNTFAFACFDRATSCSSYKTIYSQKALNGSCVPGAVSLLDKSEFLGCYPTLLPCLISENNYSTNFLRKNCTVENSDFVAFGEGVEDDIALLGDDTATTLFQLQIPVVYFNRQESLLHVSTNGLLSFEGPYQSFEPCHFPCTPEPVITPLWTDLDFSSRGLIYYRASQDPDILTQVVDMITAVNPGLSEYQPKLALVVTWFDATPRKNESIHESFQVVISTDGRLSFAALIYEDPEAISSYLNSNMDLVRIGFDGGSGGAGSADLGEYILNSRSMLESTNIFRIEGVCITTVLPGENCGLVGIATACVNFTATNCSCGTGYTFLNGMCSDIDECVSNLCSVNSNCINHIGSFSCTCKIGFIGNGLFCNDMDECEMGLCDPNSSCNNTEGSFECTCNPGFNGDGIICIEDLATSILAPVLSSILVAVVCLIIIVAALVLVGARRKMKMKLVQEELEFQLDCLRSKPESDSTNEYFHKMRQMSVHSTFDMKIAKSFLVNSCNLQLGETIGQGEFGIVYKGLLKKTFTMEYTETVAVKTLKGFMQEELVTDLLKECAKMKELDHPNVLTLKGVCLDGGPTPYIIMPFIPNGNLLSYLKKHRESLVIEPNTCDAKEVQKQLLDMCIQVGKGMEYLASKRIIHRDLAARNCMIDMGFVIKVADFGLAVNMDTSKDYFRQLKDDMVKLPIKWLAPECINDGIFSEKSDVWAFGVTSWEVFTAGRTPYSGLHPMEIAKKLDGGYRLEKPLNAACTDEIYDMIWSCWEENNADRPTFSKLVTKLANFLGSMANYLDLAAGKVLFLTEIEDDIFL